MNPFDLKLALLSRHAQHPAIVHFPIALLLASVAFDGLAAWRRRPAWAAVAHANLLAAGLTLLPTLLSGLGAWRWQLDGARLQGNLRLHLLGALASAAAIGLLCAVRRSRLDARTLLPDRIYLGLGLLAVGLTLVTGYLGGFLSGVNQAAAPF